MGKDETVFGTSGIRGIYGKDITDELAERIAMVFASGKLAVGRDIRKSGPSIFKSVCAGAFAAGAEIIDLGIAPTPTVALATVKHGRRGVMITASHNPPEYNGLKLIERGKEIGKELEKEIVRRYEKIKKLPTKEGKAGVVWHDNEILEDHKQMTRSITADENVIARKKPKVIVDCNGSASVIIPYLLSDLGCRVISVNASLDCFNRPSEPAKENLGYLSAFVQDCGADFALAHDGDGDRCIVIDENGEVLPPDAQLAIMIEHELENANGGNKKVISTVEASLTIREVVERAGGKLDVTPVGSTYVGDALEESCALFGGEPCGEYIYRQGVHVPDAVVAAAKFAEIFCKKGQFSKLKTQYPQHFIAREKFPAKDKWTTMKRVREMIPTLGIEGKMWVIDGIRLDEEDGWFLIRASGTEPLVRLTVEYKTKEMLERRKRELETLVRKCIQ